MNKKLLITSTDLMMVQFLLPHVSFLFQKGFEVDIACSNVGGRLGEVKTRLEGKVRHIFEIHLQRNPYSLTNIRGFLELKRLFANSSYDIIWTNEPVMGASTRLAAKNVRCLGTRVVYMVHGFHFYKGAPLFNWLVYYPIEKRLSRLTDVIVTINQEDKLSAERFHCKRVEYIHGIGVDPTRLNVHHVDIRKELRIPATSNIIISVGELNDNKNHKTVIKALSLLDDNSIHYIICGKGTRYMKLMHLSKDYGLEDRIHFLGYRNDVIGICSESDVFIMPSYREGLGLAALEAMYVGLPLITSNRHGLNDLNDGVNNGEKFAPDDSKGFAAAISRLLSNDCLRRQIGMNNREKVEAFLLDNIQKEVFNIFNSL